ncbi:adenylosuccinate synthetase [Patescibacteria group bacterium]|nr:adenylosuccinate synthetase [Patescibacteria group bacterium]
MGNKFVVIGFGNGDEGKGSIVDYLVQKYGAESVLRFSGGSQAGHNVVTPDGLHHTFAQFGSGTLVPGVETRISRFMLVDPLNMLEENDVLQKKGITDAMERTTLDKRCLVITPFQKLLNRTLEISRGNNRHGSCGKGVGQAVKDGEMLGERMLSIGDLLNPAVVREKLKLLQGLNIRQAIRIEDKCRHDSDIMFQLEQKKTDDYFELLLEAYCEFAHSGVRIADNVCSGDIYEGSQGVLLDPKYGFWPYITRTRTTFENADKLIEESGDGKRVVKIGVLRAYASRHGPGPLVTEDEALTEKLRDCHNIENRWQGGFRVGWFDLVATQYAFDALQCFFNLAITNMDRLLDFEKVKVCVAYRHKGKTIKRLKVPKCPTRGQQAKLAKIMMESEPVYEEVKTENFIPFIELALDRMVSILSFGPTANDKEEIRPPY